MGIDHAILEAIAKSQGTALDELNGKQCNVKTTQ